jgi:hypothetical protein
MREAAAAAFGGGLSPNSHGETAARRMRGSSARRRGETAMRRGGETAACRMSKHLRGETAARRLHGERECLVSRAVATRRTRRDGRMARRPLGGCSAAARRNGRMARRPLARGDCAARRPHGEMAAGTAAAVAPRTAAFRPPAHGEMAGNESSDCGSIRGGFSRRIPQWRGLRRLPHRGPRPA